MNRGIIITRYARAFERYVRETGGGSVQADEARRLTRAMKEVPDLRKYIASRDVLSFDRKKELLASALGGKMSLQMERFADLLERNGRMDFLAEILHAFTEMHDRADGIRRARLTVVREAPESLLVNLRKLVKEKTGDDVVIDVIIDPSVIGGFIFDIDDYLLDASVKRQLDIFREQFIERNRRII